jgi:hypothetical protein
VSFLRLYSFSIESAHCFGPQFLQQKGLVVKLIKFKTPTALCQHGNLPTPSPLEKFTSSVQFRKMNGLAIVQLIVYVLLIGPAIYIWRSHGRPGALGWGYISVFCAFRIIGGGMAIASSGIGAAIISSLGTSPLLLGALGIITEAYVVPVLDERMGKCRDGKN